MTEIKQNTRLGIGFAFITAIMWGLVPIAMTPVLRDMQPLTLVWYRFMFSAIGLGVILLLRGNWPKISLLASRRWMTVLVIAVLGLSGNFILFSTSLNYLSATAAQVIAQISPVVLMVASVVVLKEKMRRTQVVGGVVLTMGLLLFFNSNLIEIFTKLTDFTIGIIIGVTAALIWVVYALAQKILLRRLGTQQIMLLLYILCTLLLLPFASLEEIYLLNDLQLGSLIFCGVTTVISYGALAEAMVRWKAAQVSAIVTLTPLFTLLFADLLALFWPTKFAFQTLNTLAYIGAFLVVAGAMFSAVGHRLLPKRNEQHQ